MEFDLQTFLRDMRAEQLQAHNKLTDKVEAGFAAMTQRADKIAADLVVHEKADLDTQKSIDGRLQKVEGVSQNVTWMTRLGVAGILSLLGDLIWNHLPKLLAGK